MALPSAKSLAALTACLAASVAVQHQGWRAVQGQRIAEAVLADLLAANPSRSASCIGLSNAENVGKGASSDPSPAVLSALPPGTRAYPLSQCTRLDFGWAIDPTGQGAPILLMASPHWFDDRFVKVETFFNNVATRYGVSREGDTWQVQGATFLGVQ